MPGVLLGVAAISRIRLLLEAVFFIFFLSILVFALLSRLLALGLGLPLAQVLQLDLLGLFLSDLCDACFLGGSSLLLLLCLSLGLFLLNELLSLRVLSE